LEHECAALWHDFDQTLSLQLQESLPHRGLADPQLRRKRDLG